MLRLLRPANLVTALADILAGYAAAGANSSHDLSLLLISTTGLYGGGIVLNDVFDAAEDAVERPERPIPSGAVSRRVAGWFGVALLVLGVMVAAIDSALSGTIALATALCVLVYDSSGKHHAFWGPMNMGLCRALNLTLGLSAASAGVLRYRWPVALVLLGYIAGVTALSRGEVRGGTRTSVRISGAWLLFSVLCLGFFVLTPASYRLFAAPFLLLLFFRIGRPFLHAFRTLQPGVIRLAVKAGVLSLIVLDASIASAFAGFWYGLGVLLLYLPATLLGKLFSVT